MTKRILVLTFYYEPDLCAGSFRVTPLVQALRDLAPSHVEIDVLTTMPNRYATFRQTLPPTEENPRPGLRVRRIPLPPHRSGMLDQARSFFVFALGAWKKIHHTRYQLVVASSSRLMTAFLAARMAAVQKARLYLDIRDIFVENMQDVVPHGLFRLVRPIFEIIERSSYRRADRINLISPAFLGYFQDLPSNRLTVHTNGIDEEFLGVARAGPSQREKPTTLKILYAGNIGEGQGLEQILPTLAGRLGRSAHFEVIGDGGRRRQLLAEVKRSGIDHVVWHPPMDRAKLLEKYREADVLFLHLNNYPAFRRLLPSKIFEYAGTGKPIWAGLCGFAKEFAKENIQNCAVFESGDVAEAMERFRELKLEFTPRDAFVKKFRRRTIDQAMAREILPLVGVTG